MTVYVKRSPAYSKTQSLSPAQRARKTTSQAYPKKPKSRITMKKRGGKLKSKR